MMTSRLDGITESPCVEPDIDPTSKPNVEKSVDPDEKDEIISRRHFSLQNSETLNSPPQERPNADEARRKNIQQVQQTEMVLFFLFLSVIFLMVILYLASFMVPGRYQNSVSETPQLNTSRPLERKK